jgi:hypothetical protein
MARSRSGDGRVSAAPLVFAGCGCAELFRSFVQQMDAAAAAAARLRVVPFKWLWRELYDCAGMLRRARMRLSQLPAQHHVTRCRWQNPVAPE